MSPTAFEGDETGTLPTTTCPWTHLLAHGVLPGSPLRAPGPGQTPRSHRGATGSSQEGGSTRRHPPLPPPDCLAPRLSCRRVTLTSPSWESVPRLFHLAPGMSTSSQD